MRPATGRDDVAIVRAGADRIEEIGKLYAALHDHHVTIAPDVAGLPPRSRQESWRRRRERYEEWLARRDAFLLLAQAHEATIGYALVSPGPAMQSWATGERVGEIHDLAVISHHRRRGVGSRLLDAVRIELATLGIRELRLTVMAANADACRFYERHGLAIASYVMLGRL